MYQVIFTGAIGTLSAYLATHGQILLGVIVAVAVIVDVVLAVCSSIRRKV